MISIASFVAINRYPYMQNGREEFYGDKILSLMCAYMCWDVSATAITKPVQSGKNTKLYDAFAITSFETTRVLWRSDHRTNNDPDNRPVCNESLQKTIWIKKYLEDKNL